MVTFKSGQRLHKIVESGIIGETGYSFLLVFYSNFVLTMHSFWYIGLVGTPWPWKPGYGYLKVIGNVTVQLRTYDFLLTFHIKDWAMPYRLRDRRWSNAKIYNIPHVFCVLSEEVPLEAGMIIFIHHQVVEKKRRKK